MVACKVSKVDIRSEVLDQGAERLSQLWVIKLQSLGAKKTLVMHLHH